MNKERRKAIRDIADDIEAMRPLVEDLQNEEQDYFDNMPESFQNGEKGENAQTAVDALERAVEALEEAIDALSEATES